MYFEKRKGDVFVGVPGIMVALLPVSKFLLVIVLAELPASAVEAVVDDDVETTDDVDMGDAEDTFECP